MDAQGDFDQLSRGAKGEAELGGVAFCTPAPSNVNRRRKAGAAGTQTNPPPRPEWETQKPERSRKGLSAFEKRMICKAHDSMAAMLNNEDSPLLKNGQLPRDNPSGAMRQIVIQLCRVG